MYNDKPHMQLFMVRRVGVKILIISGFMLARNKLLRFDEVCMKPQVFHMYVCRNAC